MTGFERILIRGGHLIDPATEIDAPRDLLIEDGRVAAVEREAERRSEERRD